MNKILENKTALITGSGRGIGEALAIGFAKLGANIILTARTTDQIELTKNRIIEAGGKAIAVAGDIQKYEDIANVIKKGIETFGKIDILVNNAGYSKIKPITRLRVEEFQGMINTNITGVFNATHAVVPNMIENKGGAIINTGSVAITFAMPNWSVYAMTKSALTSFTTCLAEELKQNKITVNTVMPNMVHTTMLHAGRTEEQIKAMDAIQPEELVPYYAFLGSEEGKKVTGLNINIDIVKSVLVLKQKLPADQQATANWSALEPLATEALNADQLKDAKKYRKLISFLLENQIS
jgi:NAD(P)-dependent dehydrogenase (short-subunit alcohol dehydrogenase family)